MSATMIDRQTGNAVYAQIRDVLTERIRSQITVGEYLPAERVLAAEFGVNRHTVRRAVDELVHDGLVERRHGRGVAVIREPMVYGINAGTRFTENLEAMGRATVSEVLTAGVVPSGRRVAAELKLDVGDEVVQIETRRLVDEHPAVVATHFLPTAYEPLIEEFTGPSLHQYLRGRFGLLLARRYSRISAVLPLGDDAQLLQMSRRMPVLRVKSLNVARDSGRPVEYVISRFRADAFELRVNFPE